MDYQEGVSQLFSSLLNVTTLAVSLFFGELVIFSRAFSPPVFNGLVETL